MRAALEASGSTRTRLGEPGFVSVGCSIVLKYNNNNGNNNTNNINNTNNTNGNNNRAEGAQQGRC